jgi:hypothetical protein
MDLQERAAVVSVVDGIDNACDLKDWDACVALFDTEVDVDFTSLLGGSPVRVPSAALVQVLRADLHAKKASFHLRGNHDVTLSGDAAVVLSKGYVWNRLEESLGGGMWESWGFYTHRLRRTGTGWVCAGWTFKVWGTRGDDAVRAHTLSSGTIG